MIKPRSTESLNGRRIIRELKSTIGLIFVSGDTVIKHVLNKVLS